MSDNEEKQFICELCVEEVHDYEPHVRISADAAVRMATGAYGSLMDNKMMVFAVFHSDCLMETMEREDCDDVPYIHEARSLLHGAELCNDCSRKIGKEEPKVARVTRHLVLLRGGLSG